MSAVLAALAYSLGSHVNGLEGVMRGLDFGVSFAVIATLFALIFKILIHPPFSTPRPHLRSEASGPTGFPT